MSILLRVCHDTNDILPTFSDIQLTLGKNWWRAVPLRRLQRENSRRRCRNHRRWFMLETPAAGEEQLGERKLC